MNIHIRFIPDGEQRYFTLGDWFFDEHGDLIINVTNDSPTLKSEDEQFLIALHELIEAWLCKKRGITQQQVDNFDMGRVPDDEEPGDDPNAPYRKEHRFAMLIEHMMAHELQILGYGVVR